LEIRIATSRRDMLVKMIGRTRNFRSWEVTGDLNTQFFLLVEQLSDVRWRWEMDLDGEYA
jgi:hypothetical protein